MKNLFKYIYIKEIICDENEMMFTFNNLIDKIIQVLHIYGMRTSIKENSIQFKILINVLRRKGTISQFKFSDPSGYNVKPTDYDDPIFIPSYYAGGGRVNHADPYFYQIWANEVSHYDWESGDYITNEWYRIDANDFNLNMLPAGTSYEYYEKDPTTNYTYAAGFDTSLDNAYFTEFGNNSEYVRIYDFGLVITTNEINKTVKSNININPFPAITSYLGVIAEFADFTIKGLTIPGKPILYVSKGGKIIGWVGEALSVGINFRNYLVNPSFSNEARLGVSIDIALINLIPDAGPFLSFSLSLFDATGYFNWFYNTLDKYDIWYEENNFNKNNLYIPDNLWNPTGNPIFSIEYFK